MLEGPKKEVNTGGDSSHTPSPSASQDNSESTTNTVLKNTVQGRSQG